MERRAFPRLYPKKQSEQPKVTFHFKHDIKILVNTINISNGGMMGYTPSIEHFLGIEDQHIKKIEIAFPNKKRVYCSGKILRVQPVLSENKCYCAVEFSDPKMLKKPKASPPAAETYDVDTDEADFNADEYLQRLKGLDNFTNIDEDLDVEDRLFQKALACFSDVIENLTLEEKWLFCELLEEMKKKEPNYPTELKKAFLKLCRTGLKDTIKSRPNILKKAVAA